MEKERNLYWELRDALNEGAVRFTYKKKDGSIRKAIGTTNKYLIADFKGCPLSKAEITDNDFLNFVKYFDFEKNAIREFTIGSLVSIFDEDDEDCETNEN